MSKRTSLSPQKFTADEQKGLRDYWKVYESNHEQVAADLMRLTIDDPELTIMMQLAAQKKSERPNSFEILRNAVVQGDWKPYLNRLQNQGAEYAQLGLRFGAWFEIMSIYRKSMLPHLQDAYGKQPDRHLVNAINAMEILIDIVRTAVFTGYLSAKENIIRDQQQAILDANERARAEEKFRGLLESAPEAMVIVDGKGKICIVNSQTENLFGYGREELFGKPVELLIPKRFRKRHPGHRKAYFLNPLTREMGAGLELYGLRKDGSEFPAEISLGPLNTDEGMLTTAAIRDISASKHAEEALQASEQRFRAVIEGSMDEIMILSADLKPLYMSPSVSRASGFSKEEIEELEAFSTLHPDDKAGIEKMFRKFMKNPGQSQDYQLRLQRKDGSWRWVEGTATNLLADPGVAGILLNYRDVSERKQHMRELVAITTVSAALRSAPTRAEMLPIILDQILDLLEVNAAGLSMRDSVSGETVIELTRGISANNIGQRIQVGKGIGGHVIASGQPYLSNDIRKDRLAAEHELLEDFQAMGCIPLIAEGQTIGALWIARKSQIELAEVRLLTSIGNIAANAIHRATLQEQTMQHMRHIAALHAIDVAISSSFDLEFVLNVMLDQVTNQLDVDAADILLLDPHLNILEFGAGSGFHSKAIQHTEIRLGEGYAGRAALERRTVSIHDLSTVAQTFMRPEIISMEGFTTYYGVPLVFKGKVKGVLEVFHRKPLNPDREWLDFLDTLAGQAAIAIADATLFNDLQRSNIELTIAYDATIEGWSRALDLRDKETEGHTQRVTEMTMRLAAAMGLSDAELVHVRRGVLLHDIGKMGIPDNILLKPDQLTDEEWAIMRKHPTYAYEMLSPIQFLRLAMDVPYSHHEKWDGTGYPRGLKGDEIPLTARIFAVVDIWDALRSDRPYRRAWNEKKILDYIRSLSGIHLDPQVVDAFMKLIDKT